MVKEYLSAVDKKELEKHGKELHQVEKKLSEYDSRFLSRLDDLPKRGVLSEEEFTRANQSSRSEKATLEARKTELDQLVSKDRASADLAETLPETITSFLESFESLDIRQQKAHLQSILKAAHIYRDGKIELEFRE